MVHNNISLIFIKWTGIPAVLWGLLVFTDAAADKQQKWKGQVTAAQPKPDSNSGRSTKHKCSRASGVCINYSNSILQCWLWLSFCWLFACWRKQKSMRTCLVHHNLIREEDITTVWRESFFFSACVLAGRLWNVQSQSPRQSFSVVLSISVKKLRDKTNGSNDLWKDHHLSVRLGEGTQEGSEVSEGAYFYRARNKSGFPNRVSACPLCLPIAVLSASFIEVSLFVSAEGVTEAAKTGRWVNAQLCYWLTNNDHDLFFPIPAILMKCS